MLCLVRRVRWDVACVLAISFALACNRGAEQPPRKVLRLATTTSTRDSGLLEQLVPVFEEQHNCRVDVIAVGSGAALRLGESGEVDVVLVHARKAEEAFMAAGHGTRRVEFMANEFVLLGPPDDPAAVKEKSVLDAFRAIADAEARFVSRGDDSGTHQRELEIWKQVEVETPSWEGYVETGQGMGATLTVADQKRAYLLADLATFLRFRDKIKLAALTRQGEDALKNPYSAMTVNPVKNAKIEEELGESFLDFLTTPEIQRKIGEFHLMGEPLFTPLRLKER